MSEEPKRLEEPMYSDKKWGIIIILAAIGLRNDVNCEFHVISANWLYLYAYILCS